MSILLLRGINPVLQPVADYSVGLSNTRRNSDARGHGVTHTSHTIETLILNRGVSLVIRMDYYSSSIGKFSGTCSSGVSTIVQTLSQ
jgi:hypothetical protein